jgi:uncharacterized membrane protein YbhN (UPF0104 family)
MQAKQALRRWWPTIKVVLALAIVAWIGWRFARDLSRPELWQQPLDVGWLVPAALCYLAGLSFSALYWRHLLGRLGHRPGLAATFRAYFVGQLGKYVPGKALALVLRADLLRGAGVPAGLAGLAAFYEVLVTMAAGALLALLLFVATDPLGVLGSPEALAALLHWPWPKDLVLDRLTLVLLCLGLCAVILVPIYPAVFNRIVHRVTIPFRSGPAPRIHLRWLVEGLLMTAPCWPLFGLALACTLHAVPGAGLDWSLATLAYLTAVMGLAYVCGFFVPIPGALGAREYFLRVLLAAELAGRLDIVRPTALGMVVLAVLLLRLAWTVAEVLLAGALYWLPVGQAPSPAAREQASGRVHPRREQPVGSPLPGVLTPDP